MFSFILSTSPHKPLSQPCINGYIFQNGPQYCASPCVYKCSSSAWNVILSLVPLSSVQFSHSVVSNSLWPMDFNMPGFPVPHQLLGLAQTHILKSHSCSWVPLGMFLAKAFFGIGSQSQLLALSQLDNENVCGDRWQSVEGRQRHSSPGLTCSPWKTRQHEWLGLVSASLGVPYRPAPRSRWGHYLGS